LLSFSYFSYGISAERELACIVIERVPGNPELEAPVVEIQVLNAFPVYPAFRRVSIPFHVSTNRIKATLVLPYPD